MRGALVETQPWPDDVSCHGLDGQPRNTVLDHGRHHILELFHHAGSHPYGEPVVVPCQHRWFKDVWLAARVHLVHENIPENSSISGRLVPPRVPLLAVTDPESHVLFGPGPSSRWLASKCPNFPLPAET